jgi:hypothetical protein
VNPTVDDIVTLLTITEEREEMAGHRLISRRLFEHQHWGVLAWHE